MQDSGGGSVNQIHTHGPSLLGKQIRVEKPARKKSLARVYQSEGVRRGQLPITSAGSSYSWWGGDNATHWKGRNKKFYSKKSYTSKDTAEEGHGRGVGRSNV